MISAESRYEKCEGALPPGPPRAGNSNIGGSPVSALNEKKKIVPSLALFRAVRSFETVSSIGISAKLDYEAIHPFLIDFLDYFHARHATLPFTYYQAAH